LITFLQQIREKKKFGEAIIVVSGLPRSGTSMMMSMLQAGGAELLTDHIREADEDNPKGFYEFERVKHLHKEKDKSWLEGGRGKAIKIVSELLKELPSTYFYKVIFMDRDLEEVIASQAKMLTRKGEQPQLTDDEKMIVLFEKHLKNVQVWLQQQPNFEVTLVGYKEVVEDPFGHAERIKTFLKKGLDVERMASVVDKRLYRNRR